MTTLAILIEYTTAEGGSRSFYYTEQGKRWSSRFRRTAEAKAQELRDAHFDARRVCERIGITLLPSAAFNVVRV